MKPIRITAKLKPKPGFKNETPYALYMWVMEKTIVLTPPTEEKREFAKLDYFEEILGDIKKQEWLKLLFISLIPKKWKLYVCHMESLALVKIGKANGDSWNTETQTITSETDRNRTKPERTFDFILTEPKSIKSKTIRAFVEAEIRRQKESGNLKH